MGQNVKVTLPGNPHQLTVRQHFHTRASIKRFADVRGEVAVLRNGSARASRRGPNSSCFYAVRAWSERLERSRLFVDIEDRFHEEVGRLVHGGSVRNHRALSDYFILWRIKAALARNPLEDLELAGITSMGLSQERQEILESKGLLFVLPGPRSGNAVVPGRLHSYLHAVREYDAASETHASLRWGALRPVGTVRLVCPDRPEMLFMPLTPRLGVAAGYPDCALDDATTAHVNRLCREQAERFIFGHPRDVLDKL